MGLRYLIRKTGRRAFALSVLTLTVFAVCETALLTVPFLYSRAVEVADGGDFPYFILTIMAAGGVLLYALKEVVVYCNKRLQIVCRERMFRTTFRASFSSVNAAYADNGSAYYANLLTSAAEEGLSVLNIDALYHAFQFLSLCAVTVLLFLTDIYCGMATAALIAVMAVVHFFNARYYGGNVKRLAGERLTLFGYIGDTLKGGETIRQFDALDGETRKLGGKAGKLFGRISSVNAVYFLNVSIVMDFLRNIYSLFILGYSSFKVASGDISIGTALVLILYGALTLSPVRDLHLVFKKAADGFAALNLLAKNEPSHKSDDEAVSVGNIEKIEFKNVTLTLNGKKVLKNFSCVIEKGGRYRFAGKNATGKSCAVKLLSGYFRDYEGEITINGIDLRRIDLSRLYENMSVLMQESVLFDADAKENVALGGGDVPNAELIGTFGLEKVFRRKGTVLNAVSGGEKSRILLLRTLSRGKPFVILDEPLTGVNAKLAAPILEYLGRYLSDKTLIIITHDELIATLSDKVIVF